MFIMSPVMSGLGVELTNGTTTVAFSNSLF